MICGSFYSRNLAIAPDIAVTALCYSRQSSLMHFFALVFAMVLI